jgi:predicted RNase H-related nuclease YkuK (DUF458 family)
MNTRKKQHDTIDASAPFHSPTYGAVGLKDVLKIMADFSQHAMNDGYRLLIGTDSLPSTNGSIQLVTAVVFLRCGNGGIYFWHKATFQRFATLRDRMYQEAMTSIDVARLFLAQPECIAILTGDIEIHVDIGHRGPTREMIREIVGMVKANGFPVYTKPEAIAASKVADRHTSSLSS